MKLKHHALTIIRNIGLAASLLMSASLAIAEDGITLNMKDVAIETFIEDIGRLTGKTFIISPRVKGNITVISQHPMTEEEVYQTFLSVLRVQNFSAIEDGSEVVKIVADSEAKQDAVPLATERRPYQGDEVVTRVLQLHNVSAQMLVPLIRPLVPQHAHLVAYQPTNVIIISDRAANVQRIKDIIEKVDAGDSEDEIEVVELSHASAAEVVRIIENLNKQSGADKNNPDQKVKLVADERTNSILLSGEKPARLRVRSIIAHLDTPLESEGNTKVIYLHYANAKDIVQVLTGVSNTIQQDSASSSPSSRTKTTRTPSRSNSQRDINIEAHEATNSLVITAPPDILRSLESVIRQLDIRRAQVLVEAVIVEIQEDQAKKLGVDWLFAPGSNATGDVSPVGLINFGSLGNVIGAASGNSTQAASAIGNLTGTTLGIGKYDSDNAFNFMALVQALKSNGVSNVLSTPSILTLDNEKASIVVGQEVPFITGSSTGTSSSTSNPFQTIQREDVGIKLEITPQINEGDAVRLEISQEVSSVSPSAVGADLITNTREINTVVQVEDRQVIVLGGLIDDNIQQSESKVPLLGDIPLLGSLFRSTTTQKSKRNLVVFLRPTIIRDSKTLDTTSKRKYSYIRAQQLEMQKRGISLMPEADSPLLPEWNESLALPPSFEELNPALPNPLDDSTQSQNATNDQTAE